MQKNIIINVECFVTNPQRHNLVVVKVEVESGVAGYGCATFQQRPLAVKTIVDEYLKPILIGKDANNIEDLWKMMSVNSYWRNGPVINNAIAGVDMALWDIKGKIAGMPLYQLFGGKSKNGVELYAHADGMTVDEVLEDVKRLKDEGFRYIRAQLGKYGGKGHQMKLPKESFEGEYFDAGQYTRSVIRLFSRIREEFGDSIELLHDVHERLTPTEAMRFAKELEPYHLYFLEDCLPPDQIDWLKDIRSKITTPIGLGELFNNPVEWKYVVTHHLVDYLRIHVSQVGGITPALKIAHLCEIMGVNIVWHCPSDITPIGLAVNTHLSIYSRAVTIQEYEECNDVTKTVFPNALVPEDGFLYAPETPGIGVSFNEEEAEKYPVIYRKHEWTQSRIPNGSIVNP